MENIKVGAKYLYKGFAVFPKNRYRAKIISEYPTYYVAEIKCISTPEDGTADLYSQPYRTAIHKQDIELRNEMLERRSYFYECD